MNARIISVAALLAFVAVACSGDDDTATSSTRAVSSTSTPTSVAPSTTSQSTTTTPTSTQAPTTTAATVPTTGPSTSASTAPPTTAAGDIDWRTIVEALGQRRQELYAAPDVSRIPEVCGAETPCADQLEAQIGDLANKGWRVEGASPYTVVDARVEAFDGDTVEASAIVTLIVVVQRPSTGGQIVDSSGTVVADVEAETPEGVNTENRTLLGRGGPDNDPWRIISQERTGEVPG